MIGFFTSLIFYHLFVSTSMASSAHGWVKSTGKHQIIYGYIYKFSFLFSFQSNETPKTSVKFRILIDGFSNFLFIVTFIKISTFSSFFFFDIL